MDRERFRELVAEAVDGIPEPFSSCLENVEVVIEDEPSPELLSRVGLHPRHDTLFGLYEGIPLTERSVNDAMRLPDRITIFYRPLRRACVTPAAIRAAIRDTVIHEIAHFFGMEEDEIRREGY